MDRLRTLFRDPLAHFLLIGAIFFAIASVAAPPERDDARIDVTREKLLDFIQFRSKAFEPEAAARLLDTMTAEQRQRLVDDFVREEALFREAKAMGLEANDYVIKQRLVQKAEFLADAAAGTLEPSEEEVKAYFEENRARYREQPSATFTHVFFAKDRADAASRAAAAVASLNEQAAPFEAATAHGDRFPFHTNYVERTYDYVASQFGDDAAAAIFDADASFDTWRGPILSEYGAHAIYVTALTPARDPALVEIGARVAEDAARAKAAAARDAAIADALKAYDVVIAPDLLDGVAK